MGKFDKQLKYSIRKVSVGAASVVIGAFYLAMGAGVVHAKTNTTDGGASHSSTPPEYNTNNPNGLHGSNYQAKPAPNPATVLAGVNHSVNEKPETKTVTRTIKYVDASDESKEVSATVIQTVTLTRKQGTEEWTTGKWEAKTAPTVDGYDVSGNNTVEAKEVTSTTEDETIIVYYTKLDASSTTSTRGRRVRREVGDPPADGTSNTSTGNNEAVNSALTERKGSTVQPDQPGINIPKGNEHGAHDPNAHISFDDPGHNATVEEMWKIIQHMPDDFQNNERSYLRNMDTLGSELRFDKTAENPEGVPLQPGEIREISSFGGWKAIMKKDGETGKFAIGMKNEQGYFTGWYNKDGKRQEGGMLGSNALDQIYAHEQALDRRFKYMLMLAKGRTIANKEDKAQDGSPFKIATENSSDNQAGLAKLPVKEREDILQHAPNIEGFNGIEKTFTAFSTEYGSRLKIDFVTGYISDFEGSKGTYRIVVKAIKKDNSEETVYDHTINRIDGVVENEERYSQGVNLSAVNSKIKSILKGEFEKKVNTLATAKYKEKYKGERRVDNKKLEPLKEEARQELIKKGEVTYELPIDKDKLREGKKNKFKEELNIEANSYTYVANELNGVLKKITDAEVKRNSPTWDATGEKNPDGTVKSKDSDRVYKLLDFILPTAKKIIYHADTDQLELETDPAKVEKHRKELKDRLAAKEAELNTADETKKIELKQEISALKSAIGSTNAYTYTEARNGSKQVIILGSHMEATRKPDSKVMTEDQYRTYRTNELAAGEKDGLSKFTGYFVENDNVTRSNVLADDKLSKEIEKQIGGDQGKLGKGGYFSTGDIPLGKDVVSYKVQVFAENEKRVGVNKQSPRLQYNLPILADFSVIQDTTGPSKEVATRIITKLKEQGKITEEEANRIKDKIDKSKKTSEIKSAMSGDVKVKYQTVGGTVLTLKNTVKGQKETDIGKKDTDGTYIAQKDQLLGTDYNVTGKKLATLTAADGKRYKLKTLDDNSVEGGRLKNSASDSGTMTTTEARIVTYVYEEDTTPPAPVEVDASRTVKRTITYVKEDNVNGVIKRTTLEERENTVEFTGKEVTDSANDTVSYKDWTSTNSKFPKVDTPVLKGYIANKTSIEEEDATAPSPTGDVTNITREVVYTKIGSWVPKIPGKDSTPIPYPNDPKDPTKPKYPDYPTTPENPDGTPVNPGGTPTPQPDNPGGGNDETPGTPEKPKTPELPVIPYEPGYTPGIPKDPTKPVDPKINPLVPLTPADPEHPEKGYKVPKIPTTPGEDTPITYEANPQKILIKVVNITTGEEVELPKEKLEFNGVSDQVVTTEDREKVDNKIASLKQRGYVVSTKNPISITTKYDTLDDSKKGEPTQVYKILVNEPILKDKEIVPVTRTIKYVQIDVKDGKEVKTELNTEKIKTKVDKVEFSRDATTSLTTYITKFGAWDAETKELLKVDTPVLDGYLANIAFVAKNTVQPDTDSYEVTVEYRKIGSWVPRLPEGVTPPTGTDMTPKPYPNDPKDPTKPKYPDYPTTPPQPGEPTPKVPVIPYVPGYTPKTPDGNPLVPVDPEHPENGYKVPPVPTKPGEDTPITYEADPQKVVVKVFNTTTGTEVELPAEKVSIENGTPNTAIPTKSLEDKIKDLEKRGYTVDNKDLLKGKNFDTNKDVDGQDPSQVYKLLVRERTTTDTETKPVTRTIKYVKIDDSTGEEVEVENAQPTNTTTVNFTRNQTMNLVTGLTTNGKWSEKQTLGEVKTPVLEGYVANKATVEAAEVTGESQDIEEKVVYRKIGSWVPRLPKGVTPPTGTDMTPKPYPNNPNDPTKPKYPDYPTTPPQPGEPTPKVPVIPYVPGYTPKIPTDPTKPEDPNTNPLVPLTPVDPNHPENGYKVPPVPETPGKDTPIKYEADSQKAIVKYVVEGTTTVLHTEELTGGSETKINYTTTNKLAELKVLGYELVTDGFTTETGRNFDKDKTVDQTFEVTVKPKVVDVPPFDPTNPKGDDNPKPEPGKPIDPTNPNGPKWTKELIDKLETTKHVTRTITYVEDGTDIEVAKKATDKVTFTRSMKVNVVTGAVVDPNVAWTSNDTTFEAVPSPVVKGYILKANQGSEDGLVTVGGTRVVASENLTEASENQNVKVVYTKLGSWVPRLPEGVTPPEGTDMTPKPYPNNPDDPTKPGTPVYPEPGQPITPGTPVIPYVPGYTPGIPTDPTKPVDPKTNPLVPLTPVDPNHPENGYKVPEIPKTPGNNTPITYEADPQKAVVKVVKVEEKDGVKTETPLEADKVSMNGKTGEEIPDESVTAKIADLEKRGYVIENKEDVLNFIKEKFDNKKDTDEENPSQNITLKVHEKVVEVTEPPTPNTPVDPNVPVEPDKPVDPTVPKWPAEGLKESDLKKEVTRTITYVKKETPNGEEVASGIKSVTQTAHFTRKASYNVVTGKITYGNWESVDKELAKVDTPALTGYVADKASVEKVETNADSTGLDQKVVYTKLGSWVPNLPEGVKPPEGTDMTPKPYPNNPTDPTKPGTPVYPEPGQPITPGTPVIPYVSGYTPVLPKDPTKPVSPENPLEPLTPVDPTDPKKGYKVPDVPTKPGQDTPIEYVKEGKQRAITNFVDGSNNNTPIAPPVVDEGDSNKPFTKDGDVAKKIAELKAKGYDIVENNYPSKGTFDNDPKVDQYYTVKVTPHVEPVKPFDPTQPGNPDNPKPEPDQPIDPKNPDGPKWTNELINKLETKKVVTRTIQYVDEDGNRLTYTKDGKNTTLPVIDTVTFTREAKINVVTGEVTYSGWKAVDGDNTFDKVTSPIVPGYILKDSTQKEVAEKTGVSETTKDEIIQVVYKKLGSWIPKLPEGLTPPEGTDMTPKPYPNDPTDPTKPGTDKPKVPAIPGYTPMIPTDPTKPVDPNTNPLKPLDPSPNGGYEVPNIPTDPSKDIPITYVKEGDQKVIINFVDKDGKSLADSIIATGESGKKFSTDNLVNATISKLEKEGYKKTGGNYPEENDRIFDKDSKVDQVYNIVFNPNSEKPQNENEKPDPKPDSETPKQKAIIKFVVVGEDGKEREIESYRISATGKSGDTIPTNAFDETLKTLTGDPTTNGDYELIGENPLKDKPTFDNTKDEEGKNPSQVFTVKLRNINVLPPTPRIVERPGGNTVEVGVPNKDADTLFIKYTEKGKSSTDPKKEIITKKNENGDWVVEKKPEGVEITVNPKTGVVSIPSNEIQPKTNVDTQTKHKYKLSKIVSVMPNIVDMKEFNGITVWVDESGNVLKPQEKGVHTKEDIEGYASKFVGYEWKESVLEGNKITHIFKKVSTPTPYTPGEPTQENPTPQPNPEHPNVPTPSPELPNQETPIPEPDTPSPGTPVNPDPEVPTYETGKREELPNTGTESNATLAGAGIITLLAGVGLGFFKKKEEDEK